MTAHRNPPPPGIDHPWEHASEPGTVTEVAPGILWARLPLPMRLDHVNVYILDEGDHWSLIDTGLKWATSRAVWQALLDSGRTADVIPCGLGARDTLRLEAAMRLYGNDIDESTTVLEADLGWTIGWKKPDFIGRDRLVEQKEKGLSRKLVGFETLDRGIARHGHPVLNGGVRVGTVTSGTQTPFLKKAIGMAYVPIALASPGTEIDIDIRGRISKARVVPLPFYKRPQ